MENSIIVLFIKFFNECAISKMIKKAKIYSTIFTSALLIFSWVVFCICLHFESTLSNATMICISILYGLLISLILYLKYVLIILLFPNEYFLMNAIREYLGKIFRDIYLADISEEKILKHITTLSYYIANLYDLQWIRSQNCICFSNKMCLLACEEFIYFLNVKLKVDAFTAHYSLSDLNSNQISYIVYNLFKLEYESSKNKIDDKLFESLNRFLNSKIGKNFVKDHIIYKSNTFDDYHSDEWSEYNKLDLLVINQTPFYRRHINDKNKQSYNKRNTLKTEVKSEKNEKSYLSWMDKI